MSKRTGRRPLPPGKRRTEKLWLLECPGVADAICRAASVERVTVSEWLRRAAEDRLRKSATSC